VLSTGIGDAVPEWLFGDDGRIRQILFNLVGNAIKFTPEGSIAIDIDYFDRYGPPRLYIAVKDTGVGIAPEEIEPVFRSFTQADGSLSRRHEGAGLGLAIVRRLIERMGGVIDVASTPGEGTTISVTARVRPASQPAQAPPAVAVKRATKQSLSVLVVEDNRINRLLVERFLNQLGHETIASDDGMDALDKLRENDRIDLVLMDIQMPVLDGLETTRRIRGELGLTDLPVVALTAHAMKGDREEFLQAGMDDYLAKPIQRDDLERVLQRFFPQPN
jgi:CheY-like chemotaxis protein/anti-sigma regulatory factor (Ser/Thr protein kinase)